jgi:predicted MFS family arabinose efflux permease
MHRPDKIEHGHRDTEIAPGWAALLSGRNAIRSLTLAGGVALHATNVFVAATTLPSIVGDIGGLPYYAWNTTVFIVMSILGATLSTRLLQAAGPRGAYGIAALLFGLGSSICAAAPSMPVFLAGRALQGFGGGLLLAFAYAMIRLVFQESLWPRAMALVSGMWGVATLIGPALGGAFAELGAWRAAFWTLIPVSLLFALMAAAVLPKGSVGRSGQSPLPFAQLMSLIAAVFALSAGSVANDRVWTLADIAAGTVFLAILAWTERRGKSRLFPADALRPSQLLFALYATIVLLELAVTSGEIFIPLFLQVLHGQIPLVAGYIGALVGVGWTIGSLVSSGATRRSVSRYITACPILALAGMAALAMLVPPPAYGGVVVASICAALLCIGFGVGIGWPHLLTGVLKAARPGEQDLASASMTTVQLLATATGAALAGLIANLAGLAHPGGVAGASHAALWLFAGFTSMPALAILTARRSTMAGFSPPLTAPAES